jgi:hypothetical protein
VSATRCKAVRRYQAVQQLGSVVTRDGMAYIRGRTLLQGIVCLLYSPVYSSLCFRNAWHTMKATSLLALVATVLLLQAATSAAKKFSVVAIGDSLSEGWDPTTQAKTPYTDFLAPCLRTQTKNAVSITVDNKGA